MSGVSDLNKTELNADILIIGGGPGGYTAAIRAAQLGFSIALVEKSELGGVCLNWGCIPTKSLLHTADVLREINSAQDLGIIVSAPEIDLKKIVKRSRTVASRLSKGIKYLMRKNAIKVIEGEAVFLSKNSVQVDKTIINAENVIVATGASAKNLPHIQIDDKKIWGAKTAMTPPFKPDKLLIIGAGAIGVEFANFYQAIGTQVTIVEVLDQILPAEDSEIAAFAQQSFAKQGIEILTGTSIDSVSVSGKCVEVKIDNNAREFDALILSVGVTGNIESLNIESLGVKCQGGFIQVGSTLETSVKGIYAIGDVAGAPCLAHKASHEAVIAVENIAGLTNRPLNLANIPACTYSHPQVASIGLTEAQATKKGDVRIGRAPLNANGKAIAINDADGMIKTIFDSSTGELLGAHMIGPGVTEMIQGFAIAKGLETTEAELIETIFPHPTLSESMHESVLSALDRAINF